VGSFKRDTAVESADGTLKTSNILCACDSGVAP